MCIGIIRNNSLVGGHARAESNPGHWARHALLHMAAECVNHLATSAGLKTRLRLIKIWGTLAPNLCILQAHLCRPSYMLLLATQFCLIIFAKNRNMAPAVDADAKSSVSTGEAGCRSELCHASSFVMFFLTYEHGDQLPDYLHNHLFTTVWLIICCYVILLLSYFKQTFYRVMLLARYIYGPICLFICMSAMFYQNAKCIIMQTILPLASLATL